MIFNLSEVTMDLLDSLNYIFFILYLSIWIFVIKINFDTKIRFDEYLFVYLNKFSIYFFFYTSYVILSPWD